jgi:phage baseplate assembly protein W
MASLQTIQTTLNARLGSDLQFPIVNKFVVTSGVNLLIQDIQQLLLTTPGERVFRPDYGCELMLSVWENIYTAATEGASSIRTAIQLFEPRITVINISSQIFENTNLIVFNIQFQVNSTDSVFNLVFPFRMGTALSQA